MPVGVARNGGGPSVQFPQPPERIRVAVNLTPPYHDADVFGGTSEERSAAISTYLSYAGPFEVLPDEDTVVHHIEVCSFPNWIGDAQVRFAKLDGRTLTLSTKPMIFQGMERTAELVWERVGGN